MKRKYTYMQRTFPLLGGLLLMLSTSAHSVILDEQWDDWYGSRGMAWGLNTQNSAGEKLSLSCHGGEFHIEVATPEFPEVVGTDNYVKYMEFKINGQSYSVSSDPENPDSKKLFEALKKTSKKDSLSFTSLQVSTSPFSTKGLGEAMNDTDYQDCLDHP